MVVAREGAGSVGSGQFLHNATIWVANKVGQGRETDTLAYRWEPQVDGDVAALNPHPAP